MPAIPDRRLELMLVCAHPAIAPNIRTPLMLQTVLGVEAAAIADGLRRRTGDDGAAAGAGQETHPRRRHPVRAARTRRPGRAPARGAGGRLRRLRDRLAARARRARRSTSLSAEALHLALVLADLLPDEPEVLGLPRWCAFRRRGGRPGAPPTARFVPLDEQDTALWDAALIARGEALLRRAHGSAGRAASSTRRRSSRRTAPRARTGQVDGERAAQAAPGTDAGGAVARRGGGVGRGRGEIDGPDAGLRALDAIDDPAVERFQPAWTTRAHLLAEAGRAAEAADAYRRAIELTADPGVAEYLLRRLRNVVDLAPAMP